MDVQQNGGEPSSAVPQDLPAKEIPESIVQRGLNVFRKHKGKAVFALLGSWVLVEFIKLPFGEISELRTRNPRETAFMREYSEETKEGGKKALLIRRWVPLDSIPKDVVNAVVVAEDGSFWSHSGFDWFEFRESLERNLKEGRVARGASTISQQLVKNLFLSSSRNPLRKLREWILTWYLERELEKSRILEIYLNVIEWGEGVYGVAAASQTYFDKPVNELNREEAVRLAASIPNPRRHRADEESEYLARRRTMITGRMHARGMIKGESMNYKDIDALLEEGEGFQLEFKRKVSSPEKVARTLIAFANTKGGTMIFGIDDDKSIVGVDSEKVEVEMIKTAGNYHCDPPIEPRIEIVPYKGKDLIIVIVEESSQKPHYLIEGQDEEVDSAKALIRIRDKSVIASREVERILASEHPDSPPLRIAIGENERRLFDHLDQHERITVKEFGKLVNISDRRASRILIQLVRAGVLRIHTHEKEDFYTPAFD